MIMAPEADMFDACPLVSRTVSEGNKRCGLDGESVIGSVSLP